MEAEQKAVERADLGSDLTLHNDLNQCWLWSKCYLKTFGLTGLQ